MRVYVAGAVDDVVSVQAVQDAVIAAGHQLSLDWTRESDVAFPASYSSDLALSAKIATDDLEAVLDADAVLVVVSEAEGRGMFVELGAALSRASCGELEHVVVLGDIEHESVFYYHPSVQRLPTVTDWLSSLS